MKFKSTLNKILKCHSNRYIYPEKCYIRHIICAYSNREFYTNKKNVLFVFQSFKKFYHWKHPLYIIFHIFLKKKKYKKLRHPIELNSIYSLSFLYFFFFQTHRKFSEQFFFFRFCSLQQKHRKEIVARLRIWSKFTFARNSCQRNHAMREGSLLYICFKKTNWKSKVL